MTIYHDKISLYADVKSFAKDFEAGRAYIEVATDATNEIGAHYIVSIVVHECVPEGAPEHRQYFEIGYTMHTKRIDELVIAGHQILNNTLRNRFDIAGGFVEVDFSESRGVKNTAE